MLSVEARVVCGEIIDSKARVYEVASLLRAAQHMWRSEDSMPRGFVSICVFDNDGTLKHPLAGLRGVSAQVVQYFEDSSLWRMAVVSNNPFGTRNLGDIVGENNIFTPQIPWFYKQSKRAVDDLSGWLEQVAHIKPIHGIYMVGDRESDALFMRRVVDPIGEMHNYSMFLKLPGMKVLETKLGRFIP